MIINHNVPIYKVSWLNHCDGGVIATFYEPENKEELIEICERLYISKTPFDIIGHTSNIYYLPDYNVENMVSTRKVRGCRIGENFIDADCGVSVKSLAQKMVKEGVEGFEGLIDLPGTVAASVYNNSSCFNCCINNLLESFELLLPDGSIVTKTKSDLHISKRSTALKRGEMRGVILSVRLRKRCGDAAKLMQLSEENHRERVRTQPVAADNLGSVYADEGKQTFLNKIVYLFTGVYGKLLHIIGIEETKIKEKQRRLLFTLLFARDIYPYVYNWNRFIWKDEKSHRLFWKYHARHQIMFTRSIFEIEIKGKKEKNNNANRNINISLCS